MISFNNTVRAFAYKSNRELKKAYKLFSWMHRQWLVNIGTKLMPFAVKWNLPFVRSFVRNTIFKEFVGGETLKKTIKVTNKLKPYRIGAILDYGVEAGNDEQVFDSSAEEFLLAIEHAASQEKIPFISIKITGIANFDLLEKINAAMYQSGVALEERYANALYTLNEKEKEEWTRVAARMLRICEKAYAKNIGVLVDAEETWIQDPIDGLVLLMMQKYNKKRAIIFNTIQMYRRDRRSFLENSYKTAMEDKFLLGIKLVRGAYMEKERARAKQLNYPSPIQPNKKTCDREYNEAMEFCIEHVKNIFLVIATHNEESNLLATQLLKQNDLLPSNPHVCFSQLYGMGDHISFNLAHEGYCVYKYLPFGPLKEVIPYLMRRAEENSSVGGRTARELLLIKKELRRRTASKHYQGFEDPE